MSAITNKDAEIAALEAEALAAIDGIAADLEVLVGASRRLHRSLNLADIDLCDDEHIRAFRDRYCLMLEREALLLRLNAARATFDSMKQVREQANRALTPEEHEHARQIMRDGQAGDRALALVREAFGRVPS